MSVALLRIFHFNQLTINTRTSARWFYEHHKYEKKIRVIRQKRAASDNRGYRERVLLLYMPSNDTSDKGCWPHRAWEPASLPCETRIGRGHSRRNSKKESAMASEVCWSCVQSREIFTNQKVKRHRAMARSASTVHLNIIVLSLESLYEEYIEIRSWYRCCE